MTLPPRHPWVGAKRKRESLIKPSRVWIPAALEMAFDPLLPVWRLALAPSSSQTWTDKA